MLLGENKRMAITYHPANVTLTAVSAPDPTGPVLDISIGHQVPVGAQVLVCWPSEFIGFRLYFETNITSPSWVLIPDAPNHFLEAPGVSAANKFFRLMKPRRN